MDMLFNRTIISILCLIYIITICQFQADTVSLKELFDKDVNQQERNDPLPVALEVQGDPSIHHKVRVKVTTPTQIRSIDLVRVESILHPDARIITVLTGPNGQPKYQVEDIEPKMKTLSGQFFHNLHTGTVVSLSRQSDGHFHMEGHLDHDSIIAPPASRSRHPRALDYQGHTVFRSPDSLFLKVNSTGLSNLSERMERYKSLWRFVNVNEKHLWKSSIRFGVPAVNRSESSDLEEMSRKFGSNNDDFSSDDDNSEDSVEVPTEFDDKKKWQLDSRGRAQRRADDKENDSKTNLRAKFRRNIWESANNKGEAEKYELPDRVFFPDGSVNMDMLTFRKLRSDRKREKRQVLNEWTAFDLPNIFDGSTTNFHRANNQFVVEVMVMVDARAYQEFHYDWSTLQVYLLHYWQSVNFRFRELIDPNVRLKVKTINKIIFSGFQPFIENNRIEPGSEKVDVNAVLLDFKKYIGEHYESNPSLPDHDIAILLTGEDLSRKKTDGTWSQKSKGIAFIRGACISSRRFLNQSFDVGIAEVGRSFRGVLTTVHEVGHLLGAFHDGERNASSCLATSGYIMSSTWSDPYFYNRFSNCSKQNLKQFLERTWYSECLLQSDSNYTTGYSAPSQLPGLVYTLVDQCHHYIEGTPCVNVPLESQCGQLCCEKWTQQFPSREPAADGTVCGDRKMCYNGECLHQAMIPYK